jgi:hypothetical protein
MIKLGSIIWTWNAEERRGMRVGLLQKSEGKRPPGRSRRRWEAIIKAKFREIQ